MRDRTKARLLAWVAATALAWPCTSPRGACAQDGPPATLARPTWKVGDTWVIETVSDQIQAREAKPAEKTPPIRWRFKVSEIVKVGGRDCYQVDITCQAKGRLRPSSTLLVDKETMMLREMRTQMAGAGRLQTVRESYEPQGDLASPVLGFGNVLPIDLPAFLPKQTKDLKYNYVSKSIPSGAKDPDLIQFGHAVTQQVGRPSGKNLERVHPQFAKVLGAAPVVEVRLADEDKSVVQLWQKGNPWPVYTYNGRTEAKLVPAGPDE